MLELAKGPTCRECGCNGCKVTRKPRDEGSGQIIGAGGAVIQTGVGWHCRSGRAFCPNCGAHFGIGTADVEGDG